jgi:transposase-like protein
MLVELSVVEQRITPLGKFCSRVPVTQVADRYGVSRRSVHTWVRRYQESGLAGFADRSHRPHSQPRQVSAEVDTKWPTGTVTRSAGRSSPPSSSTRHRIMDCLPAG